jgi:predicted unusual protein kinase regulating ubiquinone biosynthesis (AarF/ABC1/UbiB family)
MDYQRKQGESDFDYIIRLVEGKSNGTYDIDYVELFKLAFSVELASDEARKRYYGLKMLLPFIDKEKFKNVSSDNILTELEIKKLEIQKEKEKNRTIKNELNKMLRQDARYEMFWEEINKAIDIANRKIKISNMIKRLFRKWLIL